MPLLLHPPCTYVLLSLLYLYVGHDKIKALNDVSFSAAPGSSGLSAGMRAIIGRYGPLDVGLPPSPGRLISTNIDSSIY